MPESLELPALFVEGDDDLHTILHLLGRHQIKLDKDTGPVVIKKAHGDQGVLAALTTAVRASTNRAVGFVLDANGAVGSRWESVRDRLKDVDLGLPEQVPADGYIGDSPSLKARVGVWIMPDNLTDSGRLEDLIATLVPANDALYKHASVATGKATELGAGFGTQHRTKAVLHCWLAWQREPGLPFGTALKAHFFRHDSPEAMRFLAWFKSLYEDVL
jgi:hypothetical protein